MSWSASCRIPSGTDKSEAANLIDAIPAPKNWENFPDQDAHVETAKAAAKLILGGLAERVGMDYSVNISGHTNPKGSETISASINTLQAPEAAYAQGAAGK